MKYLVRWSSLLFIGALLVQNAGMASESFPKRYAFTGEFNLGYDSFRGVSEGSWNDNLGAVLGVNLGVCMDDRFGIQAGGSYGVYDWHGRGQVASGDATQVQRQEFLTGGISYRSSPNEGFRGGLVIDAMFNTNFGVLGLSPSLQQARLQGGYLLNPSNEVGLWATLNLGTDYKDAFQIPVAFQAISQANFFWKHIFENAAETMIWAGFPYKDSLLLSEKKAGKGILGVSFRMPLTQNLSLEGRGMYMLPEGNSACPSWQNQSSNLSISLTYSLGGFSENFSYSAPYMSLANNSNFLVDTNLNN